MSKSKVIILLTQNTFKKRLKQIIKSNRVSCWFFLGRNALIPYSLEKSILKDITRLNISKHLSDSQYENHSGYINFIDEIEASTGNPMWWASRLACKNPWISNFYLRISQIDVFNKIVKEQRRKKNTILVLIEEFILFKTIAINCKNKNYEFYKKRKSFSFITKITNYSKKIKYIFKQLFLKNYYQYSFKPNLIDLTNQKNENIIIFPTFIDKRSFRDGRYKDPFLGKIINDFKSQNYTIVIIPMVILASRNQLQLFSDWLFHNQFKVYFLPLGSNLKKILSILMESKFKLSSHTVKFLETDITELIKFERNKDSRNSNLLNHLIVIFVAKLLQQKCKSIILIYPFENQKWERCLLYEIKKHNYIYSIGVQNAPCPTLSSRYFVSKKFIKHIPLPDVIIATGQYSYDKLKNHYGDEVRIYKSNSARSFLKGDSALINNSKRKYAIIGCSLGINESIELILSVVSEINGLPNDIHFRIVPHPLVNYNYSRLLKLLGNPQNIKLSSISLKNELRRSNYILFDSSTLGLEGMRNGITPIYMGHECSIHVNPNEFDQIITKYVYNSRELLETLQLPPIPTNNIINKSVEYFGDKNTKDINEIIKSIILNQKT